MHLDRYAVGPLLAELADRDAAVDQQRAAGVRTGLGQLLGGVLGSASSLPVVGSTVSKVGDVLTSATSGNGNATGVVGQVVGGVTGAASKLPVVGPVVGQVGDALAAATDGSGDATGVVDQVVDGVVDSTSQLPVVGSVTQQLGQTSFVVFKTGKHADVAADFLAYLTKKDSAEKLSQFFAPARTSLLTAENLHAAIPALSEEQLDPLVEATLGDSSVAPVPNTGSRANLALNEALDQFYYQPDADVAEAMASVCEKLNPALVIG